MTTLVIGAGIAGLSAAYELTQAGESCVVVEARNRLGGRMYTNYDFAGFPLEFGAELIHGEHVVTWEWVRKLGLETFHWPKRDDSMIRLEDGRWMTMSEARRVVPGFEVTRTWDLPDIPAEVGESWEAYLRRIGFSEEQLRYVKRSFANSLGEDMRALSAVSVRVEAMDHSGGSEDFRVLQGYASIYRALADGLDIRLNTPITALAWDDGVRAETADGQIFEADQTILTLPIGVLQANKVRFSPELPPAKRAAIEGLNAGPVMKMFYLFDEPVTEGIAAIYSAQNPPMWWSPSFGRAGLKQQLWTAFMSGDWARELLALGEEGALRRGLETLRAELGKPEIEPVKMHLENWPQDPYSLCGYSSTKPGHDGAREALGTPTPPLYWAGEATAPHHQGVSVHGALLSARRAAAEILAHKVQG